ncbi:MAG: lipopolysaccharide biosynthesis protein [Ferruginibacter sp.]|nr:lipopolysaccharide biosynthesis protein [Cytophagales bacterium]
MGIVIRQSIKSSIISYAGVIIGTVNVVWLAARFMPPSEVGLTKVLVEIALFFTAFAQLGTVQITDRFFPQFKDEAQSHGGFLVFLLLYPLIGFVLFCAVAFLLKDFFLSFYTEKAPQLIDYFYYLLPLTGFMAYQNVLEAYSRVHFRIVVPTLVRELFLKLFNSLVITLYALRLINLPTFVALLVISYGLAVVWLLLYINHLGRLYLRVGFSAWNHPLLKQGVGYGLFIIMGSMGVLLANKIDILMLPALSGLDYTVIYGMATLMTSVIEIPKRSITQISIPLISQSWQTNDLGKIRELYRKTAINQLLAGTFIFLGIWCNIDDIFHLVPKEEIYRQGKYVVAFLGIAKLIDMATGVNAEIILYSKFYKFSTIAIITLALLTVVTNYIFIPLYNVNGAGLAVALSIFVFTVIKCIFVAVKFRMHPFTIKTCYVLLMALLVYFTAMLIPPASSGTLAPLGHILLRSSVITVLFGSLTLMWHVSEEVDALVTALYRKVRSLVR